MSTVLDCIEQIPQCLDELAGSYYQRRDSFIRYLISKNITAVKKMTFIASGSSYNAAHTARLFIRNICGIEPRLCYPNLFVTYEGEEELQSGNPEEEIYILLSQGGETAMVYRAQQMIQSCHYGCISITESASTSIGKAAEFHLDLGSKIEKFRFRTIGFSVTAAICFLLSLAAGVYNGKILHEKELDILNDFMMVPQNLPLIEHDTEVWYSKHRFSVLRGHRVLIAGAGNLLPIANEADIKLMEMVPMFTRSFELEEFIHGPQNAFDSETLYIILNHKNEDEEKARSIACFLKDQIGFCALFGEAVIDSRDLFIKSVSRYFYGLEYITAFQALAYHMATDHGRDLTRGVNDVISNYIRKTIDRSDPVSY